VLKLEHKAPCKRSWTIDVYCRSYIIEARGYGRVSEEEKRTSEELLEFLLSMFESNINSHVRETILDVCTYRDDMFPYARHRDTDMSVYDIHKYVAWHLGSWVRFGEITIREDDRWWENLPIEETKPPSRRPPHAVPPRLEPAPPVEKTWFSAQFVDESGLWLDGLSVTMKIGGTSHALTTDKAGVVELRQQTETSAKVWVADIAQAEKMLVDRLERIDEAPAPTGPDVVGYPVAEPAKWVSLDPETPKLIVLGLPSWIGIELKDQDGNPVADAGWSATSSDGADYSGTLDQDGKTWVTGLSKGSCDLSFPELDAREWGATTEFNPEGETYVVQQGDHISAIAERAGFQTDDSIWMHPKNAELRAKRDNPHVLREGDELFIPTKRAMTVKRATRAMHDFVLQRTPLTLRVRVLDIFGDPVANTSGTLEYAGTKKDVTTDGDGILQADIPKGTTYATGTLGEEVFVFELGVGDLDPAQEERGSADRLNNMSYVAGEYFGNEGGNEQQSSNDQAPDKQQSDTDDEDETEQLSSALEFFQDDSGDVADGQLTEAWKQRLESEHGC